MKYWPFVILLMPFQAGAQPLQPSDKWVVDWSESQCVAYRKYDAADKTTTFMVKPSSSGESIQIVLAETGNLATTEQYDVALSTEGLKPRKLRTTVIRFYNPSTKSRYFSVTLPLADAEMLDGASNLTMVGQGIQREFALDKMTGVMNALKECTADLQQTWHIGPQWSGEIAQAANTKKPLNQYLRDYDYPQIAVDKAQDGSLDFMLLIDEKGDIRNCTIEKSTGFAILDVVVCSSVTNRAKFNPARDHAGVPIKGPYYGRVAFQWNGSGYVW